MLVRDFMTRKVFTIRIEKRLLNVQEIMEWTYVRHVPVVDKNDQVVGLVSHRDLLNASVSSTATHIDKRNREQFLQSVPIERVMRRNVQTISPEATVQEAAATMRRLRVGCLLVVQEGRLVGIITEYDLLKIIEQLEIPS